MSANDEPLINREEIRDFTKTIFRYKFSEPFMQDMYEFSKIHQHDDRETFKNAWDVWTQENENIISEEVRRLDGLGYKGNILQKMYKSSRYYFRKKSTEKKAPTTRRAYIGVTQDLLDCMDDHIAKSLNVKPELSFIEFCRENVLILQEEVKRLCDKGISQPTEIMNKVKKTYKNRYFTRMKISI